MQAADVWAVAVRSLTDKSGFTITEAWEALIDAAITSRLAAASFPDSASYTAAKAALIDAAITSRLAAASFPDSASYTAAKAAFLDAAITSRLAAANFPDSASYTAAKAAFLDAAITSRLAAASFPDSASYTAARAAKLDDAGFTRFVTASDTTLLANDAEASSNSAVYVVKKRSVVGIMGWCRIIFDVHGDLAVDAYAKIYINGVAVGTERKADSIAYVTFNEDVLIRFGDMVELYVKTGASNWVYVRNFRICGTIGTAIGQVVLA